ncbi:MAG: hypothetical protein K0B10_07130 [Vicingaceae bacterium]|nr:hypothetical protein [Vicingaceae bacterium]
MQIINNIVDIVRHNPIISITSGLASTFIYYIEPLNEIVKFSGSVCAVAVGVITIYSKLKELKQKK